LRKEIREMKQLTHTWWIFGLRGLFAVVFGVFAVLYPAHTLRTLVVLFGCYALADGVFAMWTGFGSSNRKSFMRASLVEGIIGIGLGLGVLLMPQIAELALVYLVATWAILTGAFEIFAVDKRDQVTLNAWPFGLFGLASMIAGALLLFHPTQGASIVILLLGGYAMVFGGILLHLAWRLYLHHHDKHPHSDLHAINRNG
jgi:uncharacterized membrane protein HdeD (DUF308 family)